MAPGRSQDIYAETLAVFDRSENRHEPLTTPEVADALDANRRTVYKRLRTLVERGRLETKEAGASSRVWWRPPAEPSADAGGDDDPDPRPGRGGGGPPRETTDRERTGAPDRGEHERRLRDARRFNEELVENAPFGMFRLDEDLRITYENPRAEEIIGLPDHRETSDAIGVDISELPPIVETGQADLFRRLAEGETIEFEFPFESIYGAEAYFTGRAVPLYRDGEFDGAILMATDISERRHYERAQECRREQLAALNELNGVVRGVTEAVIEQSTREEIEREVCHRVASADSYRLAWLGAVDSGLQLELREVAGVSGDLDGASFAPGPDDPTERGPTEEAILTQEIRILRRDDVREHASEFGYRSAAIIPIVHQEVIYGVLGICSERSDAFAEAEREVIDQLGDVIGHAIAAVERKRALMSTEVLELELRIPELLKQRNDPLTADWTITIERVTPLDGEEYLLYGTATPNAVEAIHALVDQLPEWKDVDVFDRGDDEIRFEQRLSHPPVTSVVAAHGGNFKRGRIENGSYRATFQFPPGTDVRGVIDNLEESHRNVGIVRQQQVTREEPSPERIQDLLAEDLTERQRVALEAGYFGGFYGWPRHRSGEEVAESLDINASTFHQHVRKAEKKFLDAIFTES